MKNGHFRFLVIQLWANQVLLGRGVLGPGGEKWERKENGWKPPTFTEEKKLLTIHENIYFRWRINPEKGCLSCRLSWCNSGIGWPWPNPLLEKKEVKNGKITTTHKVTNGNNSEARTLPQTQNLNLRKLSKEKVERKKSKSLEYHKQLVEENRLPPSNLMLNHAAETFFLHLPAQKPRPKVVSIFECNHCQNTFLSKWKLQSTWKTNILILRGLKSCFILKQTSFWTCLWQVRKYSILSSQWTVP